jgi:hypothetical protein
MSMPQSWFPPVARARVVWDGSGLRVGAADAADAELIPLPPLLKSNLLRLAIVSDLMNQRHGRCLAALLLLNLANGLWAVRLPPQKCRIDGVTWMIDLAEPSPEQRATYIIAGSFQMVTNLADPSWLPPIDGLHVARQCGEGATDQFHFAITAGGVRRSIAQEAIVADDYLRMLIEAQPRMTLEPA